MRFKALIAGLLAASLVIQTGGGVAVAFNRPEPNPAARPTAEKQSPTPDTNDARVDGDSEPADTVLDCGRNAIAESMRDLFPPAPETVRAASAGRLARCRPAGAEGVLAAAINQSGQVRQGALREEAAQPAQRPQPVDIAPLLSMTRALATFGSPVAIATLRDLVKSPWQPPEVRAAAMPSLAPATI